MAVKTFTTGEVLTASDTNTYLNNGGLVYITSASATSGTTLSVNNCFTSTYDNYLIQVIGMPTAPSYGITMRLRASGTDASTAYYWGVTRVDVAGGTINVDKGSNDSSMFTGAIANSSGRCASTIQVVAPKLSQYTNVMCQSTDSRGASGYAGISAAGQLVNTTQYDGFSLLFGNGSGTISYLQVQIYGYRQA